VPPLPAIIALAAVLAFIGIQRHRQIKPMKTELNQLKAQQHTQENTPEIKQNTILDALSRTVKKLKENTAPTNSQPSDPAETTSIDVEALQAHRLTHPQVKPHPAAIPQLNLQQQFLS